MRSTLVASAIVALGAAADLHVALRGGLSAISQDDLRAARTRIEATSQPGDVVVHSPLFTMEELAALDDLAARPDRPTEAVRGSRRVVVLDRRGYPMFGLGTPDSEERVGDDLVLRAFAPTGATELVLYDLRADLRPTTMRVERPPGTVTSRCTQARPEGGFACPGEPGWLNVEPRTLRIGGQERPCVWAHPTTGGAVVLSLPPPAAPAPGRRLVLALGAGLTDDAARNTPDGAEVATTVRQGDRTLGRLAVPNAIGWRTLELEVEPAQAVELSITTARDGRRHHCVDARIVERR